MVVLGMWKGLVELSIGEVNHAKMFDVIIKLNTLSISGDGHVSSYLDI